MAIALTFVLLPADAIAAGQKKSGDHSGKGQAAATRAAEEKSRQSKMVDTFGIVEALKLDSNALKNACTMALAGACLCIRPCVV